MQGTQTTLSRRTRRHGRRDSLSAARDRHPTVVEVGHEIATLLDHRGLRMPEASSALAVALGVVAEQETRASSALLHILTEGLTDAARATFDGLRSARQRGEAVDG